MSGWLWLVTLAIAAFRPVLLFVDFNPHVEASYQAIAHLFAGGLAGAWLLGREWLGEIGRVAAVDQRQTVICNCTDRESLAIAFWLLGAVEAICAVITIARQ